MSGLTYSVGDFLIQIKNTAMAKSHELTTSSTNEKKAIAAALKKSGFVEDFSVKEGKITVSVKFSHKKPVLMDIKLVSKPGKRVYFKKMDISQKKGPSIYLITTSKGIVTSKEAIKQGLGGEVIAEIW